MAIKTFTTGEVLTAADTNTYLANSMAVLVKSQTVGTAVSSVTVTGAFSTDYDNYRIIYTNGASSATNSLNLSFGSVTTNYFNATTYTVFSTGAVSSTSNNGVTGAFVYAGATSTDGGTYLTVDVFNPFLTKFTGFGGYFIVTDVSGSAGGLQKSNTSFTAFTITPGSGTLTGGTIYVYGYRKA
jgi:hypothetical protein